MKTKKTLTLIFILLSVLFVACDPFDYVILGQSPAPQGLSAKVLPDKSIFISWDYNAPYTDFYIYRATNDSYPTYYRHTSNNYYRDSDIVSGATYTYYIIAEMTYYSVSEKSEAVSLTAPVFTQENKSYLPAPENLSCNRSSTSRTINLSWDAVEGAGEYEIYFSFQNRSIRYKLSTLEPVTVPNHTITNFSENCFYNFYVCAVDSQGVQGLLSACSASVSNPKYYNTPDKAFELKKNQTEYFYINSSKDNSVAYVKLNTDSLGNAVLNYNCFNSDFISLICYASDKTTVLSDPYFKDNCYSITISGRQSNETIYIRFEPDYNSSLFYIRQQ